MEDLSRMNEEYLCCAMKYLSEVEGFYVCINCGVTERFTQIYDEDIYGFGKEGNIQHGSISEMYPQSSMGTSIVGNSRLAKIQHWNKMPYKERVIWEISNDLNTRLVGIFSDNIINDAISQYKVLYNKMDIHRGKNKKGMIASCVYFAANNKHTKISSKKLAQIMDIDVSTLNKCISIYIENLDLKMSVSKTREYAQDYCNRYKVEFKVQKLLVRLCDVVDESNMLLGSVPQNVCLSCLFFILKEMKQNQFTLKQICSDYNVSVNTINKILDVLYENKNYIFSSLK